LSRERKFDLRIDLARIRFKLHWQSQQLGFGHFGKRIDIPGFVGSNGLASEENAGRPAGEKETPPAQARIRAKESGVQPLDLKAELAVDSSRLQGKQAIELNSEKRTTWVERILSSYQMMLQRRNLLSELDITHTKFCGVCNKKRKGGTVEFPR